MGNSFRRRMRERRELDAAIQASLTTFQEEQDLSWSRTHNRSSQSQIETHLPNHFQIVGQLKKRTSKAILQEEEDLGDEEVCVVCWVNPKTTVIIPCGHIATCQDCASMMKSSQSDCPICRTTIERAVNLDTTVVPERPKTHRGQEASNQGQDQSLTNFESISISMDQETEICSMPTNSPQFGRGDSMASVTATDENGKKTLLLSICMTCEAETRSALYLPCLHVVECMNCASKFTKRDTSAANDDSNSLSVQNDEMKDAANDDSNSLSVQNDQMKNTANDDSNSLSVQNDDEIRLDRHNCIYCQQNVERVIQMFPA